MPKRSAAALITATVLLITPFSSAAPNDPPNSPGPLSRRLDERFSAIDREISRRREANQPDQANELADQLQYFRDRLAGKAKPANNAPQLHVVGTHEARAANQRKDRFGHATVEVTATDHPIVLALCSYNSVTWHLNVAKGVQLQKVILGGYEEQELAEPLNNIPVEIYTYETKRPPYFYAYTTDAESYPATVKALKQITGQSIASFQGIYTPKQPFIVGPENAEWLAQCLLRESESLYAQSMAFERARQRESLNPIRFKALQLVRQRGFGFSAALADFSPLGKIEGATQAIPDGLHHLAIDPAGPAYYGIDSHSVYSVDLKNAQKTELPINNRNVPRLNWASGATFDTKRGRLIVSSSHVFCYLYAYSPQKKQWSLLAEIPRGSLYLQALTYSAEHDCFFGLNKSPSEENLRASIARISPNGVVEKILPVSQLMPPTRSGSYQGFQLVPAGRQLALLTPPQPDPDKPDNDISRCLLIDPETGNVTYSGILEPQPAPKAQALAPKEMDVLWQAVTAGKLVEADQAMWKLAAAGDKAIPFLRERFAPLAAADPQKTAATLAKLEHEDFKVREQAAAELRHLGAAISAQLQALRKRETPDSTRAYIDLILQQIEADSLNTNLTDSPDPAIRLEARAIATLARIGTPAAVELLHDLASGPPGLPRTTLAKSSLLHLGRD